ncbi:MAG: DUF348 domain-containing protein [Chloroflexi bacterium]|nr:DUF348 domain-containing protein [Chloroflexota bacterium]
MRVASLQVCKFASGKWRFPISCILAICILATFLVACSQPAAVTQSAQPVQIQLTADGQTLNLTTQAATVRELLTEAGLEPGDLDEIDPPLFTPLTDALAITVTRVTEEIEIITESIPFERRFVRTDTMNADDESQIVQPGKPGLREVTVRIVFRDGLEAERWRANETILEEAQEEVVLIGIGANRGVVDFPGVLAYISGGTPVIMRGTTAVPQQLEIGGQLDGRVFSLSPDASHLLYTQISADTTSFNNSLWLLTLDQEAEPIPLEIENILWADWNPVYTDTLRLAYSTARTSTQPPGWEANNDLWLGRLQLEDEDEVITATRIIEAYPALSGWWGGNYAWSPDGRLLAYSYANEVGVVDTEAFDPNGQRQQLQTFTSFNTRADWVWVPTLTWSPDGRFLAFTRHEGEEEDEQAFDSWVTAVDDDLAAPFVNQTGMWGHLYWSPDNRQIAFLKATDPLDSLRSNYTLWSMDVDGSNGRQLYPPPGENSQFSHDHSFMTWGPDGEQMAFIFDDDLFILNLADQSVTRITQDDTHDSHPTWAPYGTTAAPQSSPADNIHRNSDS